MISNIIRERITKSNKPFLCNDNISDFIEDGEIDLLIEEVSSKFSDVLKSLIIDIDNCHNTKDTSRRVAKMFINEIFSGRFSRIPDVTDFPNKSYDHIYTVGPIDIRSTCAHHLQPIVGKCWIGVFPGNDVIGLSKFHRIVDWYSSRPQIQEELCSQIADEVENITKAQGIAVIIKAEHMCVTNRGVKSHSGGMTTSIMRGVFRDNIATKEELLSLLNF